MTVAAETLYVFQKSGSEVRTIAPAGRYLGQPLWSVERTRGASVGKRMSVPASSLRAIDG